MHPRRRRQRPRQLHHVLHLAPGVRVSAELHVLAPHEPMNADEHDVEVPVGGDLLLLVGDDPGVGVDPGEPAELMRRRLLLLLLVIAAAAVVGRRFRRRRRRWRVSVRLAVLLTLGELREVGGGLPAAKLLLQPPARQLSREFPLHLFDRFEIWTTHAIMVNHGDTKTGDCCLCSCVKMT